jgi:hypothetical protein
MTTEYVSSVGGFTAGPDNFYIGPAPSFPGVAGANGFQVAALFFLDTELSAVETLFSNEDAGGWELSIRPSTVGATPPNAIDIYVTEIASGTTVVATILNAQPGVPMLVHAHIFQTGVALADMQVDLFVNGTLAASTTTPATVYTPSATAPQVGALNGAQPALNARILGVMYHDLASPVSVSPASFYTSCREAKDMVWGRDTVSPPASDWTNRYSVRENISASATAPTTWVPSTGTVNLTRVGELNVRAHKNLDWLAAMFTTLAP